MNHIIDGSHASRLPGHDPQAAATSLAMHTVVVGIIILAAISVHQRETATKRQAPTTDVSSEHLVFIDRDSDAALAGGGGGGTRQSAPIRHAEAQTRDADRMTLRIARPVSFQPPEDVFPSLPALVLDAIPLASGRDEQLGLPIGGVSIGVSLGSGTADGVGNGNGIGVGPGGGPGFGDGFGGDTGGGPRRAGGSVTAPRVLVEVKPAYTSRAMMARIEGSVLLELIVRANGTPMNIRVTRSLDPDGLDREAVRAASQWRFAPGRLNGNPVDVVASIQIDFHVR